MESEPPEVRPPAGVTIDNDASDDLNEQTARLSLDIEDWERSDDSTGTVTPSSPMTTTEWMTAMLSFHQVNARPTLRDDHWDAPMSDGASPPSSQDGVNLYRSSSHTRSLTSSPHPVFPCDRPCSIDILPNEILHQILTYLDIPDLLSTSRVSILHSFFLKFTPTHLLAR